jgi:hypothetical protein
MIVRKMIILILLPTITSENKGFKIPFVLPRPLRGTK